MIESFLIIPEEHLRRMEEKQDRILALLEKGSKMGQKEYVTEVEARALFSRRSTWFWKMRRDGILPYSK